MFDNLNQQEKDAFSAFFATVDKQVVQAVPLKVVIKFYSVLVDFTLDNNNFQQRMHDIIHNNAAIIDDSEVFGAIQAISEIRTLITNKSSSSVQAARGLMVAFFSKRITQIEHELAQSQNDTFKNQLQEAHQMLMNQQQESRAKMEEQIEILKHEQQKLHDLDIQRQKERRLLRKTKEKETQRELQQEYEEGRRERKLRRARIEEEIKMLKEKLQKDHEYQVEERKETRKKKNAEMRERQQRQYAEQERQAKIRMRKKDTERKLMQARQQDLLEQQMKQIKQRMEKKRKDEVQQRVVKDMVRRKINTKSKGGNINNVSISDDITKKVEEYEQKLQDDINQTAGYHIHLIEDDDPLAFLDDEE